MFVVEGDGGDQLYINELAMRPHNSGHWSQDGALTSQFEQHLRAVLDWPLGSAQLVVPTVMVNVIGWRQETDAPLPDPSSRLAQALQVAPQAKIHLYGKQARRGRKLGACELELGRGARSRSGSRDWPPGGPCTYLPAAVKLPGGLTSALKTLKGKL